MITFIINFTLASLMSWFVVSIYPEAIPRNAIVWLLLVLIWYIIFWSFSFFYNRKHFYKTPKVIRLILFYLEELFIASIKVAFDVITPKDYMQPGIIAYPLEVSKDVEITMLANFITLTPGSLSIDVSQDKKILYIHLVYIENDDLEKEKYRIKTKYERRIIDLMK